MSDESIPVLVERARAGDAAAFGELFARFGPDVGRVCRRMLGGGPGAEDATSEAFLRARGALESYDPARPFRTWLLSIAGHHCIDLLRRKQTETRIFDDADFSELDLAHPGPSPLKQALRAESRNAVTEAIDALEAKYRLPLVLRYFSELEYAAIAEILEVSPNQVGTLLLRAKRRLRATLSQSGADS